MDQRYKRLHETIRLAERWAGLAEGRQVSSFALIERVEITHKQPDGSVGRRLVKTLHLGQFLHLSLFERFLVAVHGALRSCSRLVLGVRATEPAHCALLPASV